MNRPLNSHLWMFAAMAAVAVLPAARAQSDPRAGTWKLDVAKSQYTPGPPPQSETRTYEVQGRQITVSIDSTDKAGHHAALRYAAADDGQDYPLAGLQAADAIAVKRIDAHTFTMDTKKNGRIIGTSRAEISKDGKVLTLTSETHTVDGTAIHNVGVYEKQ